MREAEGEGKWRNRKGRKKRSEWAEEQTKVDLIHFN